MIDGNRTHPLKGRARMLAATQAVQDRDRIDEALDTLARLAYVRPDSFSVEQRQRLGLVAWVLR